MWPFQEVNNFSTGKKNSPLKEIKKKTGASVKLDCGPMKDTQIAIIRGLPQQMEKALEFIGQMIGAQVPIVEFYDDKC